MASQILTRGKGKAAKEKQGIIKSSYGSTKHHKRFTISVQNYN